MRYSFCMIMGNYGLVQLKSQAIYVLKFNLTVIAQLNVRAIYLPKFNLTVCYSWRRF